MFISFEGGEGCGKTTQSKMLSQKLSKNNLDYILTREPGGGESNGAIRKILVEPGNNWHNITEMLLHMASRNENLQKVVLPAIEQGSIVITDRFVDSTICYQSFAENKKMQLILKMHDLLTENFWPNVTFLLDIPEDIGLHRANQRMKDSEKKENRYEIMQIDYHRKVRKAFLKLAEKWPERIIKIDAMQNVDDIHGQIISSLKDRKILELPL